MKTLYILIVIIFTATLSTAQKTNLRLHLEIGKTYTQVMDSKANIVQEIAGQKMDITMGIKGGMTYLVKTVNDNTYDLEVRYKHLNMTMQLPQMTLQFNSEESDKEDVFSQILAEMIDKPFYIKIAKNGKIEAVKNIEALFTSAFNKFSLSEAETLQVKNQLSKAYGEEAFKGNMEMATAIFPDSPVAIGDKWTITTKLVSEMTADINTIYEFKAEHKDHYLIQGKSKIETIDKDAYIETTAGMPMKVNLTGVMVSEIKVDKNSGWILEAKIEQEMQGDMQFKENSALPEGMIVPMTIKNEMTITEK